MSSIDPTREQFDAFKALPRDEPIQMLNLIRLNKEAKYPEGHPNHGKGMSGLDAYREYGRTSAEIFRSLGGKQVWTGRPDAVLTGPTAFAAKQEAARSSTRKAARRTPTTASA